MQITFLETWRPAWSNGLRTGQMRTPKKNKYHPYFSWSFHLFFFNLWLLNISFVSEVFSLFEWILMRDSGYFFLLTAISDVRINNVIFSLYTVCLRMFFIRYEWNCFLFLNRILYTWVWNLYRDPARLKTHIYDLNLQDFETF